MTSNSEIAANLARRMLRPAVLDEGLCSGLFLYQDREVGGTRFRAEELVLALERYGAVVGHVALATSAFNPAVTLRRAIRDVLVGLRKKRSMSQRAGNAFPEDDSLTALVTEMVDHGNSDVVLILDDVDLLSSAEDESEWKALKAARDAVNLRCAAVSHFIVVGFGTDQMSLREITSRPDRAFFGATSEALLPMEVRNHLPRAC